MWLADVELRPALTRASGPLDEAYVGDRYIRWLETARRLVMASHRVPPPKVLPRLMPSAGIDARLVPVDACLSALRAWCSGQGPSSNVIHCALASAPGVGHVVHTVTNMSATPFVAPAGVARGLRRRPSPKQLQSPLAVCRSVVSFPQVPFHNNSAGVRARLFDRPSIDGLEGAWPILAAEYVAEHLSPSEWDSIEDDERVELLQEDLLLGQRGWRPLSWFDAVSHLFDLRAGNGAPPADAQAEPLELLELLQRFGRFEGGAICPDAYRAVLVFEHVVWSDLAIL
ncbi:MAG: hypothetical protein MUC96_15420 [Myxococcaceae bacterium]|nr:hypothetical protein [Myxococcaceae bacterium]